MDKILSQIPVQPSLSSHAVEDLIYGLLKNFQFRIVALDKLTLDMFSDSESHLRLLLHAVRDVAAQYEGELPYRVLRSRVATLYPAYAKNVSAEMYHRLIQDPTETNGPPGFIYYGMYMIPDEHLLYDQLIVGLQSFMRERFMVKPISRYFSAMAACQPKTMDDIVNEIQRREGELASLSGDPSIDILASISSTKTYTQPVPTGVDFIDELTNGGTGRGECTVILAQTNAGKTTLSMQMAASVSKRFASTTGEYAYLFSYEDDEALLMPRLMAHVAQVDRDRGEKLLRHQLSTTGKLEPYEIERNFVIGEQERIAHYIPPATTHLKIVDMAGQKHGFGEVPEVIAYLEGERARGRKPGFVIIDWVGEMIQRYMGTNSKSQHADDGKALSFQINNFPPRARTHIARRFNVPVVLFHQIGAGDSTTNPGAKLSSSKGLYGKNMGVRADFSLIMNPMDAATKVLCIHNEKARRGEKNSKRLIKLDGPMSTFKNVDSQYEFDAVRREIVSKSIKAEFRSPDALSRKHPTRPIRYMTELDGSVSGEDPRQ